MQNKTGDKKLDNPVWYSLSESHQQFSVDYDGIKFYHPDFCPFGGFITTKDLSAHIDAYSKMVDNFYIVGENPGLPKHLELKKELVCLQMLLINSIKTTIEENIIPLTQEHTESLFELVNLVQPGYFKRKTALLGSYFGIFKNGELVAATGERMRMNGFVEVSAIVTHPNHTRQGYAKQVIAYTANNIFKQQQTPYLHVVENNTSAINLYERLGFLTRRKISFWHITKKA